MEDLGWAPDKAERVHVALCIASPQKSEFTECAMARGGRRLGLLGLQFVRLPLREQKRESTVHPAGKYLIEVVCVMETLTGEQPVLAWDCRGDK